MDDPTHAIVGAAISYAVAGHRLGRRAALIGAVAGVFPDVDWFIRSQEDPLLYVQYHRYFTHAFLFSIAGACLSVLPWIAWPRNRSQWKIYWLAALPAYLSHSLIDASTTYGTCIFWPFSDLRAGWDLISIVDPIFTLGVLIFLVISLRRQRRGFAVGAILFACAYMGLGGIQRARAAQVQHTLAQQRGHVLERAEVMPTLANNLVWRSLYLTGGRVYSDRIRVGVNATFKPGTSLPLVTTNDLTVLEQQGNRNRSFERFAWFSDGWIARAPSEPTILGDMRYSKSTEAFDPIWGIQYTGTNGQVRLHWVDRTRQRKVDARALWDEIRGKHPGYLPVPTR
jgi:inner membrane protein